MKHELLVPVGNKECLVAAINNGADAVYLAGKKYGARAYADNFTDSSLEGSIKLCHLYGVKCYITINTLINDVEIKECLNYIRFLYKCGVDALIMQDVGIINYVHHIFPNLKIHASTQMHIHNEDTLKFLENLGVNRVVFARELSLEYINNIKTKLEKEVFIHGALCVCYSGQCLFSSMVMNRSGNKGVCAGMCRLPYSMYKENELIEKEGSYLLSPKELCSIPNFKKLMDSNVLCFKIEGRMKSPAYVSIVTRIYKKLMIAYENNEELKVNEEDYKSLCAVFNREFTAGNLFSANDLMNIKSSNHLGISVGKVIEITDKKIKILLTDDIHQFEGIRFNESNLGITLNFIYDQNDNLISKGEKNKIIFVDNFINLKSLDEVFLTNPIIKIEENITKKIPIDVKIKAVVNEMLEIFVTDGINEFTTTSLVVESAKNCPTTKEDITRSLSKLNDTPYIINKINIINDDNIFIQVKTLNELRRAFTNELNELRIKPSNIVEYPYESINKKHNKIEGISILVRNSEQLKCAMDYNVDRIYVNDISLMNEKTIYQIPRDLLNYDFEQNDYLVTDYGSLYKYPNNHADYYLNITNKYTLDYLTNFSNLITLSPEINIDQIKLMNILDENVEVIIYGNIELMIMKNPQLNIKQGEEKYYLKDRNDELYRVITNKENNSTSLMNYKVKDLIHAIKELKEYKVNNFRILLLDENYDEVRAILERVRKNE